jgi:biotin carboxylase
MRPVNGEPTLVVVGSGGRAYREYAYRSLVERYRVAAVLTEPPSWQRRYLADATIADLSDPEAIAGAVARLARGRPRVAILTWDETLLEATAQAAERLGLPHMSAAAAARCRDKYATRAGLAAAGLPAVRYRLARSAEEAAAAGRELGYPVVVKPRALAGSVGVTLAPDEAAVRSAFAVADAARYATLPAGHGVLIEEYLDGPEISVDSVVLDGAVRCVHVARKRVGFPPSFEEVGHVITDWLDEPWAQPVRDAVSAAHRALGVNHGVTHAELRLTPAGPRLVELNGRLGGDFIPFGSRLATGIDLVAAAAELGFGRPPRLARTRRRTVEIRFVYPPYDCQVERIDVRQAAATPGIVHATPLASPGDRLLLPPKGVIPRLAGLVAVGDGEADCTEALGRAEKALAFDLKVIDG